jgi:hypothetical protein
VLDRASLDELSRNFADRLFSDFGDWDERAELLMDAQGLPTGAFRLSVSQPHGERSLDVRTDEGEITVSFGIWHAHYGSYLGISDQKAVTEAVEDIQGILQDRLVVMVSHKDGAWSGSSLQEASEPPAPPRPGETAVAYSWLGTHDRNL